MYVFARELMTITCIHLLLTLSTCGGGDTLTLTHTSWSNTQILHKQYCLPMIFSSLMRQLSLAHTQTRVVQCLWFRTKEWPLKGIMGWNKAQWGPSSCRLLPGNTVGLFICYNAMYVSLCHLAGASLRPVVDQWQCQIPRLSLPVDQVRQSLPNNPALCYSSPDFFLFSSVLEVCGCTSFFFFFYIFCREKVFCHGIFNITTMLTCKMRDIFIFNVELVWCNQRNIKNVSLAFVSFKSSFRVFWTFVSLFLGVCR